MSLTASVSVRDPEGKSGIYPCADCGGDKSQSILSIVNSTDSACDGDVQFWDHYLTVRCNGCGSINFCHVSKCSEEEDFDSRGIPFLVQTKRGYPQIKKGPREEFVKAEHIARLIALRDIGFDGNRLSQMILELNKAYDADLFLSCTFLLRAILDHVPPVFDQKSFSAVANNYGASGKSFKEAMLRLENSSRKIADQYLHTPIRAEESVPSSLQVEFRAELDLLLAEVIRVAISGRSNPSFKPTPRRGAA